jgi:hypothetical protein
VRGKPFGFGFAAGERTLDLSAAGTMRGTMETSPDGATWTRLFEAVYKRR